MLQVHQFACLEDNYGYLIRDDVTGEAAAIDAPDAARILSEIDRMGWRLTQVLCTHWHTDHTGGVAALKAATGARIVGPCEVRRKSALEQEIGDGAVVAAGETWLDVLATPGHTAQHVCYVTRDRTAAFVGDTLFALGCGRVFEGSMMQMWDSLCRLAALPGETLIYCAHEYTEANAAFAVTVDRSPATAARAAAVAAARARGEWTVPSRLATEIATNPFLRAPALRPDLTPAEAFATLRKAKDQFQPPDPPQRN